MKRLFMGMLLLAFLGCTSAQKPVQPIDQKTQTEEGVASEDEAKKLLKNVGQFFLEVGSDILGWSLMH
jgi:hypothetical protein